MSCPAHGIGLLADDRQASCGCCTDTNSYRQVLEAASPDEARKAIERLKDQGVLTPDPKPCMYVYRIARDGRRQIGVVAAVDRTALASAIAPGQAHGTPDVPTWAEPATAVFDDPASTISDLAAEDMNERPLFHFNAGDGTTHSGWLARDPQRYVDAFAALPGRATLVRPGACTGCDRMITLLLDSTNALDPLPIPRCGLFVPCAALAS
ncbi:MAG: hypothetical protein JNL80_12205 [Phycisphaerae bacterium]|nr:hypothetical protein [Phycisphaerae bacterium]